MELIYDDPDTPVTDESYEAYLAQAKGEDFPNEVYETFEEITVEESAEDSMDFRYVDKEYETSAIELDSTEMAALNQRENEDKLEHAALIASGDMTPAESEEILKEYKDFRKRKMENEKKAALRQLEIDAVDKKNAEDSEKLRRAYEIDALVAAGMSRDAATRKFDAEQILKKEPVPPTVANTVIEKETEAARKEASSGFFKPLPAQGVRHVGVGMGTKEAEEKPAMGTSANGNPSRYANAAMGVSKELSEFNKRPDAATIKERERVANSKMEETVRLIKRAAIMFAKEEVEVRKRSEVEIASMNPQLEDLGLRKGKRRKSEPLQLLPKVLRKGGAGRPLLMIGLIALTKTTLSFLIGVRADLVRQEEHERRLLDEADTAVKSDN